MIISDNSLGYSTILNRKQEKQAQNCPNKYSEDSEQPESSLQRKLGKGRVKGKRKKKTWIRKDYKGFEGTKSRREKKR